MYISTLKRLPRRTESSCQTRSVSQDQVCQSKQHIQFGNLPSQTSVSCLSESKLLFHDSENMFNFGAYGRFLVFSAFDLGLGAGGKVLALAGTAIDFVMNFPAGLVFLRGFRTLVCANVRTVPIDSLFFAGQKIRSNGNVMYIGSCHFDCVDQTSIVIHAKVSLIAKMPCAALLRRMRLRVPLFLLVFGGSR